MVRNKIAVWACQTLDFPEIPHWSRKFEYPWVIKQGMFKPGEWVLDAAGGDGLLQYWLSSQNVQVINVDADPNSKREDADKVAFVHGNLEKLPFVNNVFDKVVCVSVLEHIRQPDKIVTELLRVLKPGGKLLLTFDVASYARWNHTIDIKVSEKILSELGVKLPDVPSGILTNVFPEIDPKPGEPTAVELKVLCVSVDKI